VRAERPLDGRKVRQRASARANPPLRRRLHLLRFRLTGPATLEAQKTLAVSTSQAERAFGGCRPRPHSASHYARHSHR
jgi:hypothetical protein